MGGGRKGTLSGVLSQRQRFRDAEIAARSRTSEVRKSSMILPLLLLLVLPPRSESFLLPNSVLSPTSHSLSRSSQSPITASRQADSYPLMTLIVTYIRLDRRGPLSKNAERHLDFVGLRSVVTCEL